MQFDRERNEYLKMNTPVTAWDMHHKIKTLIYKEETLKEVVNKIDYYNGPMKKDAEIVISKEDLGCASFECIISPGGSEGEYLDCILKSKDLQTRISCIKMLDESLLGYQMLGCLAGAVAKFGYEFLYMNY